MWEDVVGVTVIPETQVNTCVPPPGTCPIPYNKHQAHNDGRNRGRAWSFLGLIDVPLEGPASGGGKEEGKWDLGGQKSAVPYLSLGLQRFLWPWGPAPSVSQQVPWAGVKAPWLCHARAPSPRVGTTTPLLSSRVTVRLRFIHTPVGRPPTHLLNNSASFRSGMALVAGGMTLVKAPVIPAPSRLGEMHGQTMTP